MMTLSSETETLSLQERWQQYREENPHTRRRDAATALGVSEAELLATECGEHVIRLEGDWRKLFPLLERLGKMMALTRNEYTVHETTGVYRNVSFEGGKVGMVLGENIDLRLFMFSWDVGFALREKVRDGVRRSIQFFDRFGTAVHKVYLRNEDGIEAFEKIVADWRSDDQSTTQQVDDPEPPASELPDEQIDVEGLRNAWREMKDTHEFFRMLGTYSVSRRQAFRLVGEEFACRVDSAAYRPLLEGAASSELPIMIFVGNHGCMQIYSGKIHRLVEARGWYNILDPGFNLHLREEGVAEAWIVRKMTSDGVVTSLELYDDQGENLALFFGSRKESIVENPEWRKLVEGLCPKAEA